MQINIKRLFSNNINFFYMSSKINGQILLRETTTQSLLPCITDSFFFLICMPNS